MTVFVAVCGTAKKHCHTEVTAENEKNGKPPKAPSVGSLKRLAAFLIT